MVVHLVVSTVAVAIVSNLWGERVVPTRKKKANSVESVSFSIYSLELGYKNIGGRFANSSTRKMLRRLVKRHRFDSRRRSRSPLRSTLNTNWHFARYFGNIGTKVRRNDFYIGPFGPSTREPSSVILRRVSRMQVPLILFRLEMFFSVDRLGCFDNCTNRDTRGNFQFRFVTSVVFLPWQICIGIVPINLF